MIDMDPEDISLKYIFDHIRNYGIASTMMIAGGIYGNILNLHLV